MRNDSDCKDVDLYNRRKRYTVIESLDLMRNIPSSEEQKKSYNQNLLYREMSTRSGSNLVLPVPINFYSYTCNNVYYLIVS